MISNWIANGSPIALIRYENAHPINRIIKFRIRLPTSATQHYLYNTQMIIALFSKFIEKKSKNRRAPTPVNGSNTTRSLFVSSSSFVFSSIDSECNSKALLFGYGSTYTTRRIPEAMICFAQLWQGKVVQYIVESTQFIPARAHDRSASISAWTTRPNSVKSLILLCSRMSQYCLLPVIIYSLLKKTRLIVSPIVWIPGSEEVDNSGLLIVVTDKLINTHSYD